MSRLTILDLQDKVRKKEKIVTISAYTANMTKLADELVDVILVGDSLGMVIYGFESTLPVTMDLMINHAKAVVGSSSHAFVVVDMPFGSYQGTKEDAFNNAALLIKETGAGAVKLEAGKELKETIKYITDRGIPVMGHIGLLPQHVNKMGGYKIQGKSENAGNKLVNDAINLEEAGTFAITVEGVLEQTVEKIKAQTTIPLIGIGASSKCEGQVLVADDLLGISETSAKFVKKYANLRQEIKSSISQYATEVKKGQFPTNSHIYKS